MIILQPETLQKTIYLTGGLTMLTASLSIFGSLSIYILLFSIVIGIMSIAQIEYAFAKGSTEFSDWGLDLLRISKTITPEAYTSLEISPIGYKPNPRTKELVTKVTAYIISRAAKHIKPQKTIIKIDELEDTSLLYIQIKGYANSLLEGNQLVQVMDDEIEEHVKQLKGDTMYESKNNETTILIEFPNPKKEN